MIVGTSVKRIGVLSLLACASLPGFATDCIPLVEGVSSSALQRAVEFHQGRSPRLASAGFGCPGPCFWRLELREVVDVQPRARVQVASHPDSQSNYPPRLESRIKTVEVHHFFWGICVCMCVSLGPVLSSRTG